MCLGLRHSLGHGIFCAESRKFSGQPGWLVTLINSQMGKVKNLKEQGKKKDVTLRNDHLIKKEGEDGVGRGLVRRLMSWIL